jgi:hypothetical protein
MRRLPTEWQHFVVDRFRKEANTQGIPSFMELQKNVPFRCILNDLIEEVEDAYTVVPVSPALRAGTKRRKTKKSLFLRILDDLWEAKELYIQSKTLSFQSNHTTR